MKKTLALILMTVIALTIFTGCGDPVYDDFENFLNVEMTEVNANYTKITEEAGKWGEFTDLAQLEASLKDVMLPLVDESMAKLETINPATEEVQEIKAKYVKVMEAYKEGLTLILEGVQEQDEAKQNAGAEKISEGIAYLDEYNAALEAAAAEYGAEIEY